MDDKPRRPSSRWMLETNRFVNRDPHPAAPAHGLRLVWKLCCAARWRLAGTYLLLGIENFLELLQPMVVGLALASLVDGECRPITALCAFMLCQLVIGFARRVLDTHTFSRLYAELASGVIIDQRCQAVDVSRISARVALSRELVEFAEREVPMLVSTLFAVAGSLVMLSRHSGSLLFVATAFAVCALRLNVLLGQRSIRLNRQQNDLREREVQVITTADSQAVTIHFQKYAASLVGVSNLQALSFAATQTLVVGLFAAGLWLLRRAPVRTPGHLCRFSLPDNVRMRNLVHSGRCPASLPTDGNRQTPHARCRSDGREFRNRPQTRSSLGRFPNGSRLVSVCQRIDAIVNMFLALDRHFPVFGIPPASAAHGVPSKRRLGGRPADLPVIRLSC